MEEELVLELGKKYVLRNGLITGELEISDNGTNYIYEAKVVVIEGRDPSIMSWLKSGRHLTDGNENRHDIVREHKG